MTTSEKLRALRKFEGITQRELSELTGVHHATISNIERGNHSVSLDVYELLLDAMGFELIISKKR